MGRELTDLPFEAWVTFVFDHPAPDSPLPTTSGEKSEAAMSYPWYVEEDHDWWNPSRQPERTVAYLTNLFENASRVLTPFSSENRLSVDARMTMTDIFIRFHVALRQRALTQFTTRKASGLSRSSSQGTFEWAKLVTFLRRFPARLFSSVEIRKVSNVSCLEDFSCLASSL